MVSHQAPRWAMLTVCLLTLLALPWRRVESQAMEPWRCELGGTEPDILGEGWNADLLGQIGGESYAIAVRGTYAYMGVGPRVVVLDITNPANPRKVAENGALPDHVWDVAMGCAQTHPD